MIGRAGRLTPRRRRRRRPDRICRSLAARSRVNGSQLFRGFGDDCGPVTRVPADFSDRCERLPGDLRGIGCVTGASEILNRR